MFETVTTLCDILIALVGLFFVVKEAAEIKKEKRKEKIEERNCLQLAREAASISGLIEKISESQKKLLIEPSFPDTESGFTTKVQKELFDAISVMGNECSDIYKECQKVKENIRSIYENLLKNESMFSLSIGFDRVINVCRPIVYNLSPMLENMDSIYVKMRGISRKVGFDQCGNFSQEDVKNFQEVFCAMAETLGEINELMQAAYPFIKELEIKFSK